MRINFMKVLSICQPYYVWTSTTATCNNPPEQKRVETKNKIKPWSLYERDHAQNGCSRPPAAQSRRGARNGCSKPEARTLEAAEALEAARDRGDTGMTAQPATASGRHACISQDEWTHGFS